MYIGIARGEPVSPDTKTRVTPVFTPETQTPFKQKQKPITRPYSMKQNVMLPYQH